MLGDGIRRNLATVSKEERDLLRDAILQLNQLFYAGSRTDFPAGHVSQWFKQDEIHQSSHVHGCPQFLPWHRDFLDRFEALLRSVDPRLSLHYWDWNIDPSAMADGDGGTIDLFDSEFMGNADPRVNGGEAGEPLLSAGFYDPGAANYRDDNSPVHLNRPNPADPSTFSYPAPASGVHYNPADPPRSLTRGKAPGAPPVGVGAWPSDHDLITAASWEAFRDLMYGDEQGTDFNHGAHGEAHGYIGGGLGDPHLSFRDPFVFFMHANIDRLWAMWQRQPGKAAQRLDPGQLYSSEENSTGSGDVEFGDPSWGILSPLEPWAGYSAQTTQTGEVSNLWPIRPWFAPENEQNLPGNNKNAKDLSIVIPPSYDTAPHSSYVVANQEIFSSAQAALSLTFPRAISVIYDGFQPREVGTPTTSRPEIAFTIAGVTTTKISAVNPQVLLEDPSGAPDVPQRVTIAYDIAFTDLTVFPAATGAETPVAMDVTLDYTVGGTAVSASDHSSATLLLVNQPSPFLVDIDPVIPPPGPANPYWLSTDMRVFQVKQGSGIAGTGVTQGTDPFAFITGLVAVFNGLPDDNSHPFLTELTQDENASQLELSPTAGGTPVFNYAVAKIRYRGNIPAQNVSVFFRAFKTMVSALDYDHTGGPVGNYRRSGDMAGSVPLLGIQSNEIASIPFFATGRVNTGTQSMTAQTDDPINSQISFAGDGQEEVVYCGVWLDINDTTHQRFPVDPASDPGGINGPYQHPRLTIQQLATGLHWCLVAEIFFWPPGVTSDPIPIGSTPASSDRLAQRNLSFDSSGNPGWPSTHTVQHTLIVKPSELALRKQTGDATELAAVEAVIVPDELIIEWGNVPRHTKASLLFPELQADEIISLAVLRQQPAPIEKIDAHTIGVKVADVSFVPLPARPSGNLAGLLTLTLPEGVRAGQTFKLNVQQCSGITRPHRARRVLGAFQFNIDVGTDSALLPKTERTLSILRYIHETIPATSRWDAIFTRWLDGLAAKVTGLGGDPTKVHPSPTGGDKPEHRHKHEPCEIEPRDLLSLKIPWEECEIEGELDLKLRFKRK
jgi:Common central domain of tyrosinase